MNDDEMEKLFFSLASKSRLDILHCLSVDKLRMIEIARKVDITPTEASRQIQRLRDERIIRKHNDDRYSLTHYGELVMHFFPGLRFVSKYKQYFMAHDVWKLPRQFVSRLGELSQGNLSTELAETVNGIENLINSSDDHVWVITNQGMAVHTIAMAERISKGVKFRSLVPENVVGSSQIKIFGKNVERRILSSIPGLFSISEKEAFVSLLSMEGKVDGFGFFGKDTSFMKWANDFFLYYWEQTDRRYPKINSNL